MPPLATEYTNALVHHTTRNPASMVPLLAEFMQEWRKETAYAGDQNWVFASERMKGEQPVTGGITAQRYLRPAAVKLGIIEEGDPRRLGSDARSIGDHRLNRGSITGGEA